MIARILICTGSLIILGLGFLHLSYTFFTNKFLPRNSNVEREMKNTTPRLTKSTTLWNAWIGFNASHGLGAMYFGSLNLFLAIWYFTFFQESVVLHLLNIATLLFYLFLAKRYWFRIPLMGIGIASICFIMAFLLLFIIWV